MEALIAWLAQNIAWDVLKKALPAGKHRELIVLRRALEDSQNQVRSLEADQTMLHGIVLQRNAALNKCREQQAEIVRLKAEVRRLQRHSNG